MMGVYFPDMEMPSNCCECPMFKSNMSYQLFCKGFRTAFNKEDYARLPLERASFCKAIPVSNHGDLIDRDELMAEYPQPQSYLGLDGVVYHITGIRASIFCAETIIPSTKKKGIVNA